MRGLAMAAAARIIDPASRPVSGNEMLDMLDWLLERQPWIERSLANRHLRGGTLALYEGATN